MSLFSYSTLVALCVWSCSADTQAPVQYVPIEGIATLPKTLSETSGIIRCGDDCFYTHNDSGNKPRLYQISSSGVIEREIKVKDAQNNDWEELAEDSTYLYIGNAGNNTGTRNDLSIYMVNKQQLAQQDEVNAEVIRFEYPDRSAFTLPIKHNYDCESMIALGDSLYLFSKNRGDLGTDVYRLPKTAGTYVAQHAGHFDTHGLVTAAGFYKGDSNKLVLLGYEIIGDRYKSFLWLFTDFKGTHFFEGKSQRMEISPNLQAEAVLFETDSTLIITNEEERGGLGRISRIRLEK